MSLPERVSIHGAAFVSFGIVVPGRDVALGPINVRWNHDLNLFPMDSIAGSSGSRDRFLGGRIVRVRWKLLQRGDARVVDNG